MYLMLLTRPDIAFFFNQVSQFSEHPKKEQWAAVKIILAYIISRALQIMLSVLIQVIPSLAIPTPITLEIFRLVNPNPVCFFS
jgi:hypothetical protein